MEEPTLHPQPIPDSHHRKIELQTPHDLTYLQTNLLTSARQKLDLHFPPSAAQRPQPKRAQPATVISLDGTRPQPQQREPEPEPSSQNPDNNALDDDPLRAAVRAHVDAYLSRLYSSASHSITVNGLDATSLPPTLLGTKHPTPIVVAPTTTHQEQIPYEEKEGVDFVYEAHDPRLQKRVAEMYGELESLTVQVGKLRRNAPRKGAERTQSSLLEMMERDDAEFEREMVEISAQKSQDQNVLGLKDLPEEWTQDTKEMYERGVRELAILAGLSTAGDSTAGAQGSSLTETVGRAQRARTVAMEFE